MSNQRSPRWQGMSILVLGLAALAWEWSRDHDAVAWRGPGSVLAIILAPAFCLVGLRMLLTRGTPQASRGIDSRTPWYALVGVFLGIANAYLLGVWRFVSREGVLEVAPLLLIAGLVAGVIVVRRRRAKTRVDSPQS